VDRVVSILIPSFMLEMFVQFLAVLVGLKHIKHHDFLDPIIFLSMEDMGLIGWQVYSLKLQLYSK
jgi:hypothetical protein